MSENIAFTEKAISRVQRMSIEHPLAQAINAYLVNLSRLFWDDERGLFWVMPPNGPAQVAVWLMPIVRG